MRNFGEIETMLHQEEIGRAEDRIWRAETAASNAHIFERYEALLGRVRGKLTAIREIIEYNHRDEDEFESPLAHCVDDLVADAVETVDEVVAEMRRRHYTLGSRSRVVRESATETA